MKIHDELIVKEDTVDGVGPWYWIKTDEGAWNGPKSDWETSHKQKYERYVTDWSVCVQAGGNQGMYPKLLSRMFQSVYTFEPDYLNFLCLTMNCTEENIFKMQAALGQEARMVSLKRHTMQNTGMHTIDNDSSSNKIPMITIDSLNLQACGLMQLDLEGYEIHALHGAFNTIDQYRPVITCENGNSVIEDFLSPFGYTPVDRSYADVIYKSKLL